MDALYCFVCGRELRMGYPGGDPENGPATPRCKDNHPTVEEYAFVEKANEVSADLLHDVAIGVFGESVPRDVRSAAQTVLEYLKISDEDDLPYTTPEEEGTC